VVLSLYFCAPKAKAAIHSRPLVEELELSFLSRRVAPVLHLRRAYKPIAAKKIEGGKSCHDSTLPWDKNPN
jgi:hypothetical protein